MVQSYNFLPERLQATVHLTTTMPLLLLTCVGFCFSLSPPITGNASELTDVALGQKATHFVSVNGNDDGPGTADRPWATINHAAEQAEAGDTVIVRGGRYVLSSQVRVRNSGRCRRALCWNSMWRNLQWHEVIVSGGEVNWLIDCPCGEGLPSVDLAHVDLTGGEQRPEQHGGSLC